MRARCWTPSPFDPAWHCFTIKRGKSSRVKIAHSRSSRTFIDYAVLRVGGGGSARFDKGGRSAGGTNSLREHAMLQKDCFGKEWAKRSSYGRAKNEPEVPGNDGGTAPELPGAR